MIRIIPQARSPIRIHARRIWRAVGSRVIQNGVERFRRVENRAGDSAIRGLEGREASYQIGVVGADVAAHVVHVLGCLLCEYGGLVEGGNGEECEVANSRIV